jgi:hypothetical protein
MLQSGYSCGTAPDLNRLPPCGPAHPGKRGTTASVFNWRRQSNSLCEGCQVASLKPRLVRDTFDGSASAVRSRLTRGRFCAISQIRTSRLPNEKLRTAMAPLGRKPRAERRSRWDVRCTSSPALSRNCNLGAGQEARPPATRCPHCLPSRERGSGLWHGHEANPL